MVIKNLEVLILLFIYYKIEVKSGKSEKIYNLIFVINEKLKFC